MINFDFCSPTRIVFGKDTIDQTGKLAKEYGATKVLLHYGGQSAARYGILQRVQDALTKEGIAYVELGGVQPNPRMKLAYEGIEICKKENVDMVLALGGGSVIDSAKCIGAGAVYDGDVWNFYGSQATDVPKATLPVATVLTIPAAGSEMSKSSVMTKEPDLKRSMNVNILRPVFSVLDPCTTFTLPPYQTSCGVVDIMAHVMERYFTLDDGCDFTDRMCEAALLTAIRNAYIVLKDPTDYDARANIMWLGSIAHNDLLSTGRTPDFATHQIGMELSAEYDVAHGATLSAIFPHWMRYVSHHKPQIFIKFATRVFGVEYDYEKPERAVELGIQALVDFYRSIDMPVCLSDLKEMEDTSDEMLRKLSKRCNTHHADGTVGNFARLTKEDVFKIYQTAR
ncbi:MAG: iron-containing alcohol dehydrogenase [Christensenellales bacterium]|jgi:alcohol dehydrogenase YqhD (iron-dependent ADH family)